MTNALKIGLLSTLFFCLNVYAVANKNSLNSLTNQMIVLQKENSSTYSPTESFLNSDVELAVRETILALVQKMNDQEEILIATISDIENESIPLNASERYLVYRLYASLSYKNGEIHKAINWANKAISYQEQMTKSQLETPLFIDIYADLSKYYSEIESYQQAYDNKRIYIDRYRASRIKLKDDRIAALNAKYETALKQNENLLLKSQNALKLLKIKEAENEENKQLRNIFILIFISIVFLVLLARQIKVRKKLKILAKTDVLTGLFNRRSLFEKGNQLVNNAVKTKTSVCTILLDIDFFKSINDSYGHDVGDKVIKMIADIGSETIRSRDYFARLGGEEFAAILPEVSLDEAKAFAERLREKVEQLDLSELNIDHEVTVSIGLAHLSQVVPHFDNLLNAADEAMYNAKEQGRNKVCCYQPS